MEAPGAGELTGAGRRALILGFGYSAERIASLLLARGWGVSGTSRTPARLAQLERLGVRGVAFDDVDALNAAVASATDLVVSLPPDRDGTGSDPSARDADAGLRRLSPLDPAAALSLRTIAYLSTTGVYGDRGGDWVHECTPPAPGLDRTRRRVAAEHGWAALAGEHALRSLTFRLSGIYGPGRSVLDRLRDGTARRVTKPGGVTNRIHVDDLAACVVAGLESREAGVFNVSDDLPAPSADVVAHGAELLGLPLPPEIPWTSDELSEMARSFHAEDRRVGNGRLKADLRVDLRFPTYREGLAALAADAPRP